MTARGEYKTPGGKLIAVEFDVEDGRLRDVMVTGDFFLYPEDALPRLGAALEGQPATLDEREYAALVQPVLDSDVELLGSSARALAIAVVRAVRTTTADEGDERR
jgi:lipoate---protein ligase